MPHAFLRTLATFRTARRDAGFQRVLTRLARLGMMVGASLGLAAVLLFVGIYAIGVGKTLSWSYADETVALWDKVVIIGLCATALALARHVRLNGARLLVAALAITCTIASVADDVVAGDTSFSPGYLTFIYLLAVVATPFRPLQTLSLGVALSISLFLCIEGIPALFEIPTVAQVKGHYVYLSMITATLSGGSGLLYITRYRQFRAQREAERLREDVQALEAAKTRFFTNISHEFRTPLTLVLGPLEDALAGRYGPVGTRLRRRLQEMHVQARQLRDLINQLLDLSKLDAGAMSLKVREHDLAAFVRQQAELFRSGAEREETTLHIDTPEAPLPVWFDAEKMGRVMSNLLSNALKHTPPGGMVRVRVAERPDAQEAVVSVRDSGEGLPPDMLSTLFDRFASGSQVPDGTTSTGIGLALVKEIVERHRGRVEATSEPGFGAEFVVRLPLGSEHVALPDRAEPGPSEAPASEKLHPLPIGGDIETVESDAFPPDLPDDAPMVLVADDDAPIRRYVRDVLDETYRVLEASDGEAAWTLAQEHRPALVISDVMMPVLDGFALCRRIRNDERLATTPIVFLTARAEEEARIEGWKTGADAYLTKPFSGEELSAVTENLIEVRQLLHTRVKVPDWMETKAPDVPSPDAEFLDRVQQAVGEHIDNTNFGVEWLADEVGLSARQLQRRLKKLTRLTAAGFIKTMRLEHAAQLLDEGTLQVQEVAHAVGYEDANYFSRLFRQAYGVPPSEYTKEAT